MNAVDADQSSALNGPYRVTTIAARSRNCISSTSNHHGPLGNDIDTDFARADARATRLESCFV